MRTAEGVRSNYQPNLGSAKRVCRNVHAVAAAPQTRATVCVRAPNVSNHSRRRALLQIETGRSFACMLTIPPVTHVLSNHSRRRELPKTEAGRQSARMLSILLVTDVFSAPFHDAVRRLSQKTRKAPQDSKLLPAKKPAPSIRFRAI
eukprot:1885408-Pleurochrysis_carterae.AAC.1